MNADDHEFPRSYKRLHGAPYDDDPGPWPYLAVLAFAALAAAALVITLWVGNQADAHLAAALGGAR